MGELVISTHDFEESKRKIEKLSGKVPSKVNFNTFPTEGNWIPWRDHKVTGKEINDDLVLPLQSTIRSLKSSILDLFTLSKEVYKAFEALDRDYIQGIVIGVKSAEEASNQARTASDQAKTASNQALDASAQALEASEKASKAQDDITKTIDALQITVSSLKHFKETTTSKLDLLETSNKSGLENLHRLVDDLPTKYEEIQNELQSYKHLDDVDATWEDVQAHKIDLSKVQQRIKEITRIAEETTGKIHDDLSDLQKFQTLLLSYSHLCDVDALWADVQEHKTDLSEVHEQISEISSDAAETTEKIHADLATLHQFQTLLQSYSHLSDVDATWEDVQAHKSDLSAVHQQVTEISNKAAETTEKIHADLATLHQFQTLLQSYSHLSDVDAMWDMTEDNKSGISNCHLKISNLEEEVQSTSKDLSSAIDLLNEESKERELNINKKLKIAYVVAGISLALTVIQFILRIIGIL